MRKNISKNLLLLNLLGLLIFSLQQTIFAQSNEFITDIDDHDYEVEIKTLCDQEIWPSDQCTGKFNPNALILRSDQVEIILRAAGLYEEAFNFTEGPCPQYPLLSYAINRRIFSESKCPTLNSKRRRAQMIIETGRALIKSSSEGRNHFYKLAKNSDHCGIDITGLNQVAGIANTYFSWACEAGILDHHDLPADINDPAFGKELLTRGEAAFIIHQAFMNQDQTIQLPEHVDFLHDAQTRLGLPDDYNVNNSMTRGELVGLGLRLMQQKGCFEEFEASENLLENLPTDYAYYDEINQAKLLRIIDRNDTGLFNYSTFITRRYAGSILCTILAKAGSCAPHQCNRLWKQNKNDFFLPENTSAPALQIAAYVVDALPLAQIDENGYLQTQIDKVPEAEETLIMLYNMLGISINQPLPEPEPILEPQPTPLPEPQPTPLPEPQANSLLSAVWANDGEDKVIQDDLRASANLNQVVNSLWDGAKIMVFGARNEVVNFNLVLEAGLQTVSDIKVTFNELTGPEGMTIGSTATSGDGLFDWQNRNIELFYVRYLEIKGLSKISMETYDERHIPRHLRRPHDQYGIGQGNWNDRPDHNQFYPEIAVPLELESPFVIKQGQNQSIWADIYIPQDAPAGIYYGQVTIRENNQITHIVPVELEVKNFTLPDTPRAKTMVFISNENIDHRYDRYGNKGANYRQTIKDRHFLMAHRHRISLIDADYSNMDRPSEAWVSRLNGSLFTSAHGYNGPGSGVGNGIYSIGTYGSWNWKNEGEAGMRRHSDNWVNWFDQNAPQTEYFLYLIDESGDYATINQWAQWINDNPGPGYRLLSMATTPLVSWDGFRPIHETCPELDIPAAWIKVAPQNAWELESEYLIAQPDKKYWMYNAGRPATGTFATEDDGVALRQLAWSQYKKGVDRWFFWESTYYNNYQGGMGQTNVFQKAQTFGSRSSVDTSIGETGWNYSNGDGVLFYPGTDLEFPIESYDLNGPIASLRLKHWRRGIQDVDYLAMAAHIDPKRVEQIVGEIIPQTLWEYGVTDMNDPTWVRTEISWSDNPEVWEQARKELAEIIVQGGGDTAQPASTPNPTPSPQPQPEPQPSLTPEPTPQPIPTPEPTPKSEPTPVTITHNPLDLISPAPYSTLTGAQTTLVWEPSPGSTTYNVAIGRTAAAIDYGWYTTSEPRLTVSNLPTNGTKIYIRIFANNLAGARDFEVRAAP